MARYREYSYEQTMLLPVSLGRQIQPNTLEYTINFLVDHEISLSVFEARYRNDETGALAIDPAILLKIILLPADTRPHFTTIADFVSSCLAQISPVFRDILAVCSEACDQPGPRFDNVELKTDGISAPIVPIQKPARF
jgi:hypothetical protein